MDTILSTRHRGDVALGDEEVAIGRGVARAQWNSWAFLQLNSTEGKAVYMKILDEIISGGGKREEARI